MYEDLTVEKIKSDILSRIHIDIDTREGSFTNDVISAVAYEIWKCYQSLDALLPIVFVDETSGEYIDKRCAEYGIIRKPGTKAKTTLIFSGVDGTVIPAGKAFLTASGLEFITDKDVTIEQGTATVTATAAEIGDAYNVAAGTINKQYVNISGLTSITNTPATGGTNPETDAALVKRLYLHLQSPATSGNVAHYRQWALEVPGCGDAKVFPLWNGPGTVKVLVVDENKQPATETLIQEIEEHIESLRPIGAKVTVVSAISKSINVSAKAILASGYSLQTVNKLFAEALTDYLRSIAFITTYVSYAKIGTILLGTDGVIDYSDLIINGTNTNIPLEDEEIPVLGRVDLEV